MSRSVVRYRALLVLALVALAVGTTASPAFGWANEEGSGSEQEQSHEGGKKEHGNEEHGNKENKGENHNKGNHGENQKPETETPATPQPQPQPTPVPPVATPVAPQGTPASIIAQINQAVAAALSEADIRQRLVTFGYETWPMQPAEVSKLIEAETSRYASIIRSANISFD